MVTAADIAKAASLQEALIGVAATVAAAYSSFMLVSDTVLRYGDLDQARRSFSWSKIQNC